MDLPIKLNVENTPYIPGKGKPDAWLQIVQLHDQGLSNKDIASFVGTSKSLVTKVLKRKAEGETLPRKVGRKVGNFKLKEEESAVLSAIIESTPNGDLQELKAKYTELTLKPIPVCDATLYNHLKIINVTRVMENTNIPINGKTRSIQTLETKPP